MGMFVTASQDGKLELRIAAEGLSFDTGARMTSEEKALFKALRHSEQFLNILQLYTNAGMHLREHEKWEERTTGGLFSGGIVL